MTLRLGIVLFVLAAALEVPFLASARPSGGTCPGKNLATDSWNCGACGNICQHGSQCARGACVCGDGRPLCGGELGQCCDEQHACSHGTCVVSCPASKTQCAAHGGWGAFCADVQNDNSNCGACFNVCPSATQCEHGRCVCGEGLASCGGACLLTSADAANCGACGKRCGANMVCDSGACRRCARGQTLCDAGAQPTIAHPLYCTDLHDDDANCGKCGHHCPDGFACIHGHCER